MTSTLPPGGLHSVFLSLTHQQCSVHLYILLLATQPSSPWFSPPYCSPNSAAQPAVCSWLLIFPHLPHLYALKGPQVMYSVSTSSKQLIVWSPSTQKVPQTSSLKYIKASPAGERWRGYENKDCGVAPGEQEPTVAASLSTLSSITYGGNNTAENSESPGSSQNVLSKWSLLPSLLIIRI